MSEEILRIRKSTLDAIGNSIRAKSGKTALINPLNMPAEILSLNAIGGSDDEEITTSTIHYLKGTDPCLENGPWWIYPGETHSFVEGDGCLTLTASDNYGSMVKAIDLTDVDTVTVVMASTSIGEYAKKFGGVFIAKNAGDAQTISVAKALVTQKEKAIYTIDVSSLSGTHFLRAESFNNVVISFYEIYGTYSTPKPIKTVTNSLNYSVVGGTVEPSNPRENTIWINTDTNIYTYSMINTIPSGEAEEGAVCFVYTSANAGTEGQINILKKNEISIKLISCYQYVDGTWVDKIAKVYQNNNWIDLGLTIVPNEITYPGSSFVLQNATYAYDGKTVKAALSINNYGLAYAYIPIDISEYAKMKLRYTLSGQRESDSYTVHHQIGLTKDLSAITNASNSVITNDYGKNHWSFIGTVSVDEEIDISELNGIYYLFMRLRPHPNPVWYASHYTIEEISFN